MKVADVSLGFELGRTRLLRRPTAVASLLAAALVVAAAMIERRFGSAGAVDRVLEGTFNLAVPLLAFAIVGAVTARRSLSDAVWPIARHGADRRGVAIGLLAAGLVAGAALCGGAAILATVSAHAAGNPPLGHDAWTSGWIGALTGAAYVAWFSLGATFGKRGGARWLVLLADAALAGKAGVLGAILPRAHAESLLGGSGPMHLSQPASTTALAVGTGVAVFLAALRAGP